MKSGIFIIILVAVGLISACSNNVGPTEPKTYTETYFSDVAKLVAKTSTDRQGINLNLTLTTIYDRYYYPQVDSNYACLTIEVYEYGELIWCRYYNLQDWYNLFGSYELEPGFNYSCVAYIKIWDLPKDIQYGKIKLRLQLRDGHNNQVYPLYGEILYDFGTR